MGNITYQDMKDVEDVIIMEMNRLEREIQATGIDNDYMKTRFWKLDRLLNRLWANHLELADETV